MSWRRESRRSDRFTLLRFRRVRDDVDVLGNRFEERVADDDQPGRVVGLDAVSRELHDRPFEHVGDTDDDPGVGVEKLPGAVEVLFDALQPYLRTRDEQHRVGPNLRSEPNGLGTPRRFGPFASLRVTALGGLHPRRAAHCRWSSVWQPKHMSGRSADSVGACDCSSPLGFCH